MLNRLRPQLRAHFPRVFFMFRWFWVTTSVKFVTADPNMRELSVLKWIYTRHLHLLRHRSARLFYACASGGSHTVQSSPKLKVSLLRKDYVHRCNRDKKKHKSSFHVTSSSSDITATQLIQNNYIHNFKQHLCKFSMWWKKSINSDTFYFWRTSPSQTMSKTL